MTDSEITHGPRHVALVGDMAVGKSTVGRLLAAEMSRPFLDSDDVIETRTGRTTGEIAGSDGLTRLHDLELEVFVEIASSATPAVIAPAASVIDHQIGRELLVTCTTVWLFASEEALEGRRRAGSHRRPVTDLEAVELRERRHPLMAEVALARIDTTATTPDQTVEQLFQALGELT